MKIRVSKKYVLNINKLLMSLAILAGIVFMLVTIKDFASHPADFATTGTWKHLFGG